MKVICRCLKCGAAYSIDEQSVGRSARCKRCGDTFVLKPDDRTRSSGQSGAELPAVSQSEMATPGAHSQAGAGPDDTPDATQSWSGKKSSESVPRQIGRFRIRARLGAGGFGAVYRAYDPVLAREVALKVPHRERLLSEQDRARVLREAKAAAQLRHANIVPVHDAGVDGHYFYIASAFIEGPTLAKILRGPGVGFREAARVTMDLAGALQHAHDRGIVHRDVKPGNVMLDSNGTALLTDFGLAHVVESETMLTQEGVVLGTPAYMAPEQARGETNLVGPASDQYSLGVVLYQMLCRRLPFEGPPCAVVARLAHELPPKPRSIRPDVPRELESICLRAMSKSNLDRYASCGAMADDLDRWLRDEGPAAGPPPWDRAWTWTQRHRKPLAVGASGLALGLVLMVALFQVVVRIRHRDGPDTVVRAPTGSEVEIGEDGSVAVTPPRPSLPVTERDPIDQERVPETQRGLATALAETERNLEAIGMALKGFHDGYGCLPPAVVLGPDGKPWHSWRVLILPFLGSENRYLPLYSQYDFGQPWDSPRNRMVMSVVPREYQTPLLGEEHRLGEARLYTHFAAVTGRGAAFPQPVPGLAVPTTPVLLPNAKQPRVLPPDSTIHPPEMWIVYPGSDGRLGSLVANARKTGPRLRSLDGTIGFADFTESREETILVGTISMEHRIPWTEPKDISIEQVVLLPPEWRRTAIPTNFHERFSFSALYRYGDAAGGVFLMADGTTRLIRDTVDVPMLRAMCTPSGGEVVVLDDIPTLPRPN